jgi:hypothetical protein
MMDKNGPNRTTKDHEDLLNQRKVVKIALT